MKKIITKILLLLTIFSLFGLNSIYNVYAEDDETCSNVTDGIKVTVTENIPGACCNGPYNNGTYECTVEPGFGTVVSMMGEIIKYFTFLVALGGVLYIVYNGIMYSMGGMEQSLKDDAKKRIVQTLIGLIVLFMSGLILNVVAPWIYTS